MKENDRKGISKRVLFVTVYPSPYRVDFFNELGKKPGIDLSVVFLERPDEQKHRSNAWFREDYTYFRAIFPTKRINLPRGGFLCPELITLLREKYDEIIFGGYSDAAIPPAMAYLKLRKVPYSIEIDGGLISEERWFKYWIKHCLLSSADKWYSSGAYSDRYLIHYGADPERIFHYPFTSLRKKDLDIDLDHFQFEERKKTLRKDLGISEVKAILAVGQFVSRKGFDILLQAALKLDQSVGIYIVGGEAPKDWIDFCNNHRLKNVHFMGFMSHEKLWKYYKASDLFVFPTRIDIWGLVINEAIANGLPVITTEKCVAGHELVEEGKNGFLVPVNDANALADAINRAFSMDLYEMRKHSLRTARVYTIENMADTHFQVLSNYWTKE